MWAICRRNKRTPYLGTVAVFAELMRVSGLKVLVDRQDVGETMLSFHPALAAWFDSQFTAPSEIQRRAWPLIRSGRDCLIAAPTGSGKTFAAFFCALDALARIAAQDKLEDRVYVLYISPLKALSNDIRKNLEDPLAALNRALKAASGSDETIRAQVRTGDTPQAERARMRKCPPHILVTTPESFYLLLTSASGRRMLAGVGTVIVDEIHALCGNKRGAHLALSLERLAALDERSFVRLGLSATQKPLSAVADFLTGGTHCEIVDAGHVRARDLALELPKSPLAPVTSGEVWAEIYDQLAELARAHRSTLIFVNTRRMAERVARHLAERLGETEVAAHHGSLAREQRLEAEQRLKAGQLRALIATASLELGIDIGDVDLVCQLGSPRGISVFLQRVGRSGHSEGKVSKGRLFPLSRDDLVECAALLHAVSLGRLDELPEPPQALDVLAQQIVAEVACREWDEAGLYSLFCSAWPYRGLKREVYDQVLAMVSDGFSTRHGRRGAYLHRDEVNGKLRARRGAVLTAVMNGGTIPDQFDYDVVLEPEGQRIGTLNEDFAFESLAGDIFQLGNSSYRILRVAQGRVHAEDARGQPPNIPFWFGEAPGRSDALSIAVSELREILDQQLELGPDHALNWLDKNLQLSSKVSSQLCEYLGSSKAVLGVLPSQRTLILERFFDQVGDPHLVLHSPFGSRINRALGLALRKRFCRKFDFELQAAAVEDSLLLSLGPTHSFPLEEVAGYLTSAGVRDVLVQALLDSPLFGTRWRWNASIALAVRRYRNGRRAPAQFQRSEAEDLLALVFPEQLACQENLSGPREIPDHPLVHQTLEDCLNGALDVSGLEALLSAKESHSIKFLVRELNAPSPLAQEVLSARAYAFLDDAPAEERRALTVRFGDMELALAGQGAAGKLDADAVARVRDEVWPDARSSDELHDALVMLGFMTDAEMRNGDSRWAEWLPVLLNERRVTSARLPGGEQLWIAAERLSEFHTLYPQLVVEPRINAVGRQRASDGESALVELLRSRLESLGPVGAPALIVPLGLGLSDASTALAALEREGFVFQGRYTSEEVEWCERRLLVRIQRYTLSRLRKEIEPVSVSEFMQFLFAWHRLLGERRNGVSGVLDALRQLEAYPAPAGAWEKDILPARVAGYDSSLLDASGVQGRMLWLRSIEAERPARGRLALRSAIIFPCPRIHASSWLAGGTDRTLDGCLASPAKQVLELLRIRGALYASDIRQQSGLLPSQLEEALTALLVTGQAGCDGFAGFRVLMRGTKGRRRSNSRADLDDVGRWFSLDTLGKSTEADSLQDTLRRQAQCLLARYGVLTRALLAREPRAPRWRELAVVLRRMEARGELRGGRFIHACAGEQFALPEAVEQLRALRKRPKPQDEGLVTIAACDPLNLTGLLDETPRIAAMSGHRILYRNGTPVAVRRARKVQWLEDVREDQRWALSSRLDYRCYRESSSP